ncbi:MAG: type IV secretion system DNA-binding domain-containing protein [Candidatus Eisenbacteria bacterium]
MSQIEELTAEFYEWETRGRGWLLWEELVALEPPFVPFEYHGQAIPAAPPIDDGRRPSFFSSLFGGSKKAEEPSDEDFLSPYEIRELVSYSNDLPLVELQVACPPDLRIEKEAAEQLLLALFRSEEPIAFEIIGHSSRITLQVTARESDAEGIRQVFLAYFPDIVITRKDGFLESTWRGLGEERPYAVVDFGLSQEFMLPLRTFRSFDVDPLSALFGVLSGVGSDEVALLQVLFQGTRHNWDDSVLRSVVDPSGEPFFLDAPLFTELARRKVARPLFSVVLRAAAKSGSEPRSWLLAQRLAAGLEVIADPGGNQLVPLSNDGYEDCNHEACLLERTTLRSGMLLSSDELVSLVHLPSESLRVPELVRHARKTRSAPNAVRGTGLLLGENVHGGEASEVRITPEQRSRHVYVIGASGTGKSTLLLNMILQDLERGEGFALLDPHGDLVDDVLARLPEHRLDDVILLNPADEEYPIGWNVLAAHSKRERQLLSSDFVAVFRRLSETWGDQMDSVFSNAVDAFLASKRGGTLADLRRFLLDATFRKEVLATVEDPRVLYFWQKEFPLFSGRPVVPILTRLDLFLRPEPILHMVIQAENRLDFRSIMDEGKVLLARLSVGGVGEKDVHLLGTLLVSKFQQIAVSREGTAEEARRPFYLYIDEFHNFITPTMETILSGGRKYRLSLVLAHQMLQQLASRDPDVLNGVLTNPGTRVCYRLGEQDAKVLEKGFSSYNREDLQRLGTGQAICRVDRSDWDFNLDSPDKPKVDPEKAQRLRAEVVARSRARYGRPQEEVQSLLREATGLSEPELVEVPKPPKEKPRPPAKPPRVEAEESREPVPEPKRPKPHRKTPSEPGAPKISLPTLEVGPIGRGGKQHRYLQGLIKRWGEAHGWSATVEEGILDGLGSVDVALRKESIALACEIAVTTDTEHELGNLQKCLAGGFDPVVAVSAERKTLRRIQKRVEESLEPAEAEKIAFCTPEELFAILDDLDAQAASSEGTVRGYKVKVRFRSLPEKERSERRGAIAKVVAQALTRLRKDEHSG